MTPHDAPPPGPLGLWRRLPFDRSDVSWLTAGVAALAGSTAAAMLVPRVMHRFAARLGDADAAADLDAAALRLLALLAVFGLGHALRLVCFSVASERFTGRLRRRLFDRTFAGSQAEVDMLGSGGVVSRLVSDAGVVQAALASQLPAALRHLLVVVGGAVLMLRASTGSTAAVGLVMPPLLLAAAFFGRRVRRHVHAAQEALRMAVGHAEQAVALMPTLRACAAENGASEAFARAVDRSVKAARRRAVLNGTFIGLTMTLLLSAVAAVTWWAGHRVARGELALGDLIEWLAYQGAVLMALAGLSDGWSEFIRATAAVERLGVLLTPAPPRATLRPQLLDGSLVFENVSYRPPGAPAEALRDVSLTVWPGEFVAVVGASGSGKSTLCRLAWGLHAPDAGRVLADGHDLADLDVAWWRSQVGIVLQEPALVAGTVADNLRLGRPDLSTEKLREAAGAALLEDVVHALLDGFESLVGSPGAGLSGGERQRLALARAFARTPRLFVLDEPTSALDPAIAAEVHAALATRLAGRTALVVTHRLELADRADRVVVLEGGRIVEEGPPALLRAKPNGAYRRLAGMDERADAERASSPLAARAAQ